MADNNTLVNDIYGDSTDTDLIEVTEDKTAKVTNMEEATRYAYGLSETRNQVAEYDAIAKSEIDKWQEKIDQVKSWLEDVTKPLKEKEEYMAAQLQFFHTQQYHNAKEEKDKKKLVSIKLPYGVTLKSRAGTTAYEVTDETLYRSYAAENKLLKPVKEPDVDWASLKKNIIVNSEGKALNKETGEFLDFIKVLPQERKFEVK